MVACKCREFKLYIEDGTELILNNTRRTLNDPWRSYGNRVDFPSKLSMTKWAKNCVKSFKRNHR